MPLRVKSLSGEIERIGSQRCRFQLKMIAYLKLGGVGGRGANRRRKKRQPPFHVRRNPLAIIWVARHVLGMINILIILPCLGYSDTSMPGLSFGRRGLVYI